MWLILYLTFSVSYVIILPVMRDTIETKKVLMECECCGQEDRISEETAKKEDTDYWMCESCAAADDHCLGDPN